MPAVLNNAATADGYTDALTAVFGRPRKGFALNVFNNAVMYQLGFVDAQYAYQGDIQWEAYEHHLTPSLTTFRDVITEGGPAGGGFAGVRVRSAATGLSARVTVI